MPSKKTTIVKKIIGEDSAPPESGMPKMIVVRIEDFEQSRLAAEIADIEDDNPLLVRVDFIPAAVDESMWEDAIKLVKDLKAQGVTHIYTG